MKITTFLFTAFCVLFTQLAISQNVKGKANDEERIVIGVSQPADGLKIPYRSYRMLANRISQAASLNGLSAERTARVFNIVPQADVLTKEVTATAPPLISTVLELSLKLTDRFEGSSYSQVTYELKGVGKTEEAAYTQAFRQFNARDPRLRSFFVRGKDKIIEYYNSRCDLLLAKADGYVSAGKYTEAYEMLINVPPVCRECYDKVMLKIDEFGDKVPAHKQTPQATVAVDDPSEDTSPERVELINGLTVTFRSARLFGEKLVVTLTVNNPAGSEKEMAVRRGGKKNYIINGNGEEIAIETVQIANKKHHYGVNHAILPGTPVEMKYVFPKQNYIRQLVMYINENTYKMNDLTIQQ